MSRCNTTCMMIILDSGIPTNRVATGFQATIRSTDQGKNENIKPHIACNYRRLFKKFSASLELLENELKCYGCLSVLSSNVDIFYLFYRKHRIQYYGAVL